MKNARLGDLTVARIGLGAMGMSHGYTGAGTDDDESIRTIHRALDLGVNFIDTAEIYGPYVNEELVGRALKDRRDDVVLATKFGLVSHAGQGPWNRDSSPANIRTAVEGSLRRLGTDRIDLYYQHRVDPNTPIEDTVGAVAELIAEGKVRHIGLSNVSVKELERARKIVPIVSVQNRYSLADRGSEDVLRHCEQHGIAFLPWYPLGDGSALKKAKVISIAGKIGATPAQVAIAWLLKKSPVMLPIPGTNDLAHLEENVAAAKLQLSEADFRSL